MRPKTFIAGHWILALLTIATSLVLVSWDFKQPGSRYLQNQTDTVPKNNPEKKIRDLDDVLDELNRVDLKMETEKAQKEIAEAMKEIDGDKIKMEVEKAMSEVDLTNIQKEVQESMANLDMAKMQKEIQQSMKEIDGEKIKMETEKAMSQVDFSRIQKEVQESIAKIDWDKMKTEMDKVKNMDMGKLDDNMKKLSGEMKELGPKIEKEMQKANVEIEKAKVEMRAYKEFVDGLEKDGLLNKKEGYTIKHKDGGLIVNGKKVPAEVYSKYRNFLENHKKFSIEKSNDDFNIDMD
jgi:hypothetical protein